MFVNSVTEPPTEIRLRKASKRLEVLWTDGSTSSMSCFDLRRSCACSSCQAARRTSSLQLIDVDVGIDKIEISGISGLQFHFSDGHSRGLFPWCYLRELSEQLS
jgi:DUF971 family protein